MLAEHTQQSTGASLHSQLGFDLTVSFSMIQGNAIPWPSLKALDTQRLAKGRRVLSQMAWSRMIRSGFWRAKTNAARTIAGRIDTGAICFIQPQLQLFTDAAYNFLV